MPAPWLADQVWANAVQLTTATTYPVTMTLTSSSATTSYYSLGTSTWNYVPQELAWEAWEVDEGRAMSRARWTNDQEITWPNRERWGVRPENHHQSLRAQDQEFIRARTAAVDRATATLLGLLNDEQRASYQADRTFMVLGSHGGVYRIGPGSMGNVEWFDPASPEPRVAAGRLCAHPARWDEEGGGYLPDPDVSLGQLLHLTTDEPGFIRTANVHTGRAPRYPTDRLRVA